ncbi:MAG: carboxypeptidase regulatory-like domain-containing protein [Bacteroidota bacterium]
MKIISYSKILATALFFIGISLDTQAQLGKIFGNVTGKDGEKAVGATVQLQRDGAPVGGIITGKDGKFEFARLDPGQYTLKVTDENRKFRVETINVGPGETKLSLVDMAMAYAGGEGEGSVFGTEVQGVQIYGETTELFTVDPINPYVITGPEINKRPIDRGNLGDIVAVAPRVTQSDQGDPLNMSGSRANSTATFINGTKVRGSSQLPIAGIEQVSVINGGIPAEFGDVTGGIIIVNTKNPGMRGYFGPENPNQIRRAVRKKYKRLKKKGDDSSLTDSERIFSMNSTKTNLSY